MPDYQEKLYDELETIVNDKLKVDDLRIERSIFISEELGHDPKTIDTDHYDCYEVHYRKNPTFTPNRRFGLDEGFENEVEKSYAHVVSIWLPIDDDSKGKNLEKIFQTMQGHMWSPEGEARELIIALGLHHTSMSVGDLVENTRTGRWYETVMTGFENIY